MGVLLRLVHQLRRPAGSRSGARAMGGRPVRRVRHPHPAPRNLVRSDQHCVYGIVATATHAELARLYAHARDVLGEVYLPEAVLVQTLAGLWRPALCYICPEMNPPRPTTPTSSESPGPLVSSASPHGISLAWKVVASESRRTRRHHVVSGVNVSPAAAAGEPFVGQVASVGSTEATSDQSTSVSSDRSTTCRATGITCD